MDAEIVEKSQQEKPTTDLLLLLEIIANKIQPSSPIAHWQKLKIAANEGFLLSTSEVKQLVGINQF
ncbi:MAG: hypothetical protein AB4426_22325 [Xenococcaceae cyanobacterium]